jgi:acetyl CoA:N6-hydroxylysine acetyl transferase
MLKHLQNLPPLFCKPISISYENEILFFSNFRIDEKPIVFRSLQLSTDTKILHDWVNRDYAKRFWNFARSERKIADHYFEILKSPHTHSFIGLLEDRPVCQVDIYLVIADELHSHILQVNADDSGMHFLMAPLHKRIPKLSTYLFCAFLEFYFSFPMAQRMFGEPDEKNINANKLVVRVGFQFLKTMQLAYKTANLYSITKNQFYAKNKVS